MNTFTATFAQSRASRKKSHSVTRIVLDPVRSIEPLHLITDRCECYVRLFGPRPAAFSAARRDTGDSTYTFALGYFYQVTPILTQNYSPEPLEIPTERELRVVFKDVSGVGERIVNLAVSAIEDFTADFPHVKGPVKLLCHDPWNERIP